MGHHEAKEALNYSPKTKEALAIYPRESGILCHVSSLPNDYGIGDFGKASFDFIDSLASAGQKYWQVLPLNPVGDGFSPYSSVCSFAGEWMYISPAILLREKLLKPSEVTHQAVKAKVDFEKVRKGRMALLKTAFSRFKPGSEYEAFLEKNKHWLESYAAFDVLSRLEKAGTDFWKWPETLKKGPGPAVQKYLAAHSRELDFVRFLQFNFFKQWAAVREHARKKGVAIIGDLPIFVALSSSDVWANQSFFCLNDQSEAAYVAGVPPDYFNADGQVWGNALYDWSALEKSGFQFWVERAKQMQSMYDLTRIDHFIGFYRYWEIPAGARNAKKGTWRFVPGEALFKTLDRALGGLPFIAEDLGKTTPEVFALRDQFALPGMRVLHFGFGATYDSASYHLPYNYPVNCIAYSGTHDNNTTRGWWDGAKRDAKKSKPSFDFKRLASYFPSVNTSSKIARVVHLDLLKSAAKIVIVPLQDLMGLGEDAKMNVPGTGSGNWAWRAAKVVKKEDWQWLREACRATGRLSAVKAPKSK